MKASSFWSFILRRLAKAQGFLDPIVVFSRLQRFAQPAEVWVPTELLRSGAVLQARGLVNSQAIQHNLDWIWPFWVGRQFDPGDVAFIPRAFSMTHINLTHRNWTAIGLPDFSCLPIVDPRGLVTPFFDGWSIDGWIMSENVQLIPSRLTDAQQTIDFKNTLAVSTHCRSNALTLDSRADVRMEAGVPVCQIVFKASAPCRAWLAVSPRPYNPEGISFINDIHILPDEKGWIINQKHEIHLSDKPTAYLFSNYLSGDICEQILSFMAVNTLKEPAPAIACPVGMASAAALYELEPHCPREIVVKIPLAKKEEVAPMAWASHLQDPCRIKIPDQKFQFLYEVALRTLILHSPGDVYPGPFTYKRFWFRDAAFILNAMITTGLLRNIEHILDRFPSRQKVSGYFMSQDGEWDSNGQAIWIIHRFAAMTHTPVKHNWLSSIYQGARWIQWKRLSSKKTEIHAGLMPAGFSAEHFGPSDFYYWDDFWSAAGLRAASSVALAESPDLVQRFKAEADDLLVSVEKSLDTARKRLNCAGVPASPYRRMDGGAIGSLVSSYPLQLWPAKDPRILNTVDFLMRKYFLEGAFYQEISHSGINAYLSLHVAQVLLRAEDPRFFDIVKSVADLASPTGQWPEAIHPKTKGGCMGDGQHVWAAAEWVLMMRNMFVREEEATRTLILCSGIPEGWLREPGKLFLGPALTLYGKISVSVDVNEALRVSWDAKWHEEPPVIEVHLPGYPKQVIRGKQNSIELKLNAVS